MSRSARIEAHYLSAWGAAPRPYPYSAGPIHGLPRDFAVLRLAPHGERAMWTYATSGMSQPGDAAGLELHMFSPRESDDVAELLVAAAHFHRTGATLGLGHTVNFGRPWLDGSACTHGLISLPYLDGPYLETLHLEPGIVRFLWLIPITEAEVAFKKANGVDVLEERFDSVRLDYLNPARDSVV